MREVCSLIEVGMISQESGDQMTDAELGDFLCKNFNSDEFSDKLDVSNDLGLSIGKILILFVLGVELQILRSADESFLNILYENVFKRIVCTLFLIS